jgi:hypothetical protein
VTKLGCLLSQSVGLVPGDEHQLVIFDSVGDGMYCDYRDGLYALLRALRNCGRLIITCSIREATVC